MSNSDWWGDWRPNLPAHTGDLQPTDLIECTMIVGGLPVNTVITGAQILGAVPSGGGLTIGTTAIASGTIGRILFQGTGNVLQQNANLFWDNTNGRLGIGQSTPTARIHIQGSSALSANSSLVVFNSTPTEIFRIRDNGNVQIGALTDAGFKLDVNGTARVSGAITGADGSSFNGVIFDGGGTRRIRPSINSLDITDSAGAIGFSVSSSGTTISQSFNSVQFVRGLNSMVHSQGATQIMTFTLRGQYVNHLTPFSDIVASGYAPSAPSGNNTTLRIYTTNTTSGIYGNIIISHNGTSKTGNVLIGTSTNVASAIVNVDSTTQGFLPPRMTNAQMLAIAAPAAGLVVYDTTNNKHCGYNGTAWQNFY